MIDHSEIRVLVIDDEWEVRETLGSFLEDQGFVVTLVDSAEKALEILLESTFDVAIVDLRLRGMTGDAFTVRAHEIAPGMRFLIHTGAADLAISDELQAIGVGTEHMLLKPIIDMTVIVDRITELLAVTGAD